MQTTLKRINDYPERSERVPRPESHAQDAEHGGDTLEIARYGTACYYEAEGGREERHRDGGPGGEEQQRYGRLGFLRDGRKQQQREPARTADAVHQPDAVR